MTLSVGDRLPEADLFVPGDSGAERKTVGELFAGRKIVLVGMPGAFTPTCMVCHARAHRRASRKLVKPRA